MAGAMMRYHAMAVRTCSPPLPSCPIGFVTVVLPPGSSADLAVLSARFASAWNGTHVVTVLRDGQARRMDNSPGLLSAALVEMSGESVLAGPYSAANQSVGSPARAYRIRQPDGTWMVAAMDTPTMGITSARLRGIPAAFVPGLTLTNGAPVVATPLN